MCIFLLFSSFVCVSRVFVCVLLCVMCAWRVRLRVCVVLFFAFFFVCVLGCFRLGWVLETLAKTRNRGCASS